MFRHFRFESFMRLATGDGYGSSLAVDGFAFRTHANNVGGYLNQSSRRLL